MPNDFSGENIGDTATTDLGESVRDNAPVETGNPWENILNDEPESVPDDAQELEESLESDDEQIPSESEDSTEKPKSRSENFKDLKEAKVALETQLSEKETVLGEKDAENQTLKDRIAQIDELLEIHGGVEAVEGLAKTNEVFLDAGKYREAVDYLDTLPQAPAIRSEILNRSLGLDGDLTAAQSAVAEATRIEVLNRALASQYGLNAALSPETIDLALNWLATRANQDTDSLVSDINEELAFLSPKTPEQREAEATKQRIADLEAKLEQQSTKPEKEEEAKPFDAQEIETKLSNFESEILQAQIAVILKDYETSFDKLSSVKQRAIKSLIRFELGSSPVFIQHADYLLQNPDHPNAKYLRGQYANAVRTATREIVADFLGKPKSVSKPPSPSPTNGLSPNGKMSIQPVKPPKTEKSNVWANYEKELYST
jgi:hypothetical protein